MMVHLCCFWPVKTIGCQQQETTCDVAGCDAMKREYRYIKYISFWNWLCIWSYTNCRLFEILAATESKHESIRISRNEIELFCFLGGYPFSAGPIFHAMAGCVISLPSTWTWQVICRKKVWRCSPGSSFYWLCYLPHWWITLPRWDAMPPNQVIDPMLLCRWL